MLPLHGEQKYFPIASLKVPNKISTVKQQKTIKKNFIKQLAKSYKKIKDKK